MGDRTGEGVHRREVAMGGVSCVSTNHSTVHIGHHPLQQHALTFQVLGQGDRERGEACRTSEQDML